MDDKGFKEKCEILEKALTKSKDIKAELLQIKLKLLSRNTPT